MKLYPLPLSSCYLFLAGILMVVSITACSSYPAHHSKSQLANSLETSCRMIQHTMGDTCVPNNPQHLITISRFTLANALVLGIKPIASTSDYEYPSYLRNKIEGIDEIGEMYEPDLEKILLLKPDLILGWEIARKIYPLLSQIIPTALGKWEGGTRSWREHFNFVAEALGKQEAAQQAWNRYYQRIQKLKIAVSDQYKDKEISIIGVYGGMRIYSDTQDSFAGSILNDIGLHRVRNSNSPLPISEEKLEEVDGDIIFVMIFQEKGEESRKAFEKLQQKPLWQTLRAVEKGQVYLVDREAWIGSNLIAADAVIDDLYKYLVNTP
ncbi:iron-siderophore ABC transporter substrate-binding protein [Nostoc foliaceum]|nr:iron-siderophore ABC transporter substrate-binding protein [Nostoc foliaceum]